MTRTEKLSLWFSALSLIISIASPLVGYFWLVPSLRDYELRGRLQITSDRFIEDDGDSKYPLKYEIKLINSGRLPAKDIRLDIIYPLGYPDGGEISVFPPMESDVKNSYLLLKRPLPPNDTVLIQFSVPPTMLYISTETGDTKIHITGLEKEPAYFKKGVFRAPAFPQNPRRR